MAGIGEQGHGIGDDAIAAFDQHKGRIERNADGEGPAEGGGRMNVAVGMMIVVMGVAHIGAPVRGLLPP